MVMPARDHAVQDRYERVLNSIDAIVWEAEAEPIRMTYVSPPAERILGYPLHRWTSEPDFWMRHIHPDDREWVARYCAGAIARGESHTLEYRMLAASGKVVWLRDRVSVETSEDGRPCRCVGVMLDVTERKEVEARLEASNAETRDLYENAPCGYHSLNPDGVFIRVNATLCRWLGYTHAELLGKPIQDVLTPESARAFRENFPRFQREGLLPQTEFEMVRRDGSVFPAVVVSTAVFDNEGRFLRSRSAVTDITERRRAESAVREEKERYRYVTLATSEAIYDRDLRSGPVIRNAMFDQEFGPTETPGQPLGWWEQHLHPDDRARVQSDLERAFREHRSTWSSEYRLQKRDGSYSTVVDRAYVLYDDRGVPTRMLGAMTDISARRLMEDALRQSEERFRTLARGAPVGIFRMDSTGRCTYANERLCDIFGVPAEALLGDRWHNVLDEKDRDRVVAEWNNAAATARPWMGEYRAVRPDGRRIWVLAQALPLKDPEGEQLGYVGTITDISDRKAAEEELRRHREHLEELVAERTRELAAANQELESFSYSVSHDLRAPLRAIDGFSRLLEEDAANLLAVEHVRYLERIRKASQRMAQLIDDLLRLSRVTRAQIRCELVPLDAMARDVAAELVASPPERKVEWVIEDGMVAQGDRALLRIVVENLLANAWKFTSKNPTARIEFSTAREGGQTTYRVRDDGVGFNPEYTDRLFKTFNRLHGEEEFEGTGIGLATVRRVVERHGGTVRAEGAVGKGATITFTLAGACPP